MPVANQDGPSKHAFLGACHKGDLALCKLLRQVDPLMIGKGTGETFPFDFLCGHLAFVTFISTEGSAPFRIPV
jgi:hypothetical protein